MAQAMQDKGVRHEVGSHRGVGASRFADLVSRLEQLVRQMKARAARRLVATCAFASSFTRWRQVPWIPHAAPLQLGPQDRLRAPRACLLRAFQLAQLHLECMLQLHRCSQRAGMLLYMHRAHVRVCVCT